MAENDKGNASADTPEKPAKPQGGPLPAMATADASTPDPVSTDRSVPSAERPNEALSTVDDVTMAAARREYEERQGQDQKEAATATEMPSQVLAKAFETGPITATSDQAEKAKDVPPLVLAPTMAAALAEANKRQAAPAPELPVSAVVAPDIGAGAADAANRTVLISAPAQPKRTSDGLNAGAIAPTGYIAPVRVSAAGVPASDPTVLAGSVGDLSGAEITGIPGSPGGPGSRGPGTSDRPEPTPSTGVDASHAAVQARLNGDAQAATASPDDPAGYHNLPPNVKAAVDRHVSAITGSPQPASAGDRTLTTPVSAGDREAARRVASIGTEPPPAPPKPRQMPGPADTRVRRRNEDVATAVDKAKASNAPGNDVNAPLTARPADGSSPSPVTGRGGEGPADVRQAADRAPPTEPSPRKQDTRAPRKRKRS